MTIRQLIKKAILPALLSIPILIAVLGLTSRSAVSEPSGDCGEFCCPIYPNPCVMYYIDNCWAEPTGCQISCFGFFMPNPYPPPLGYCVGQCTYTPECNCDDHPFFCGGQET